MFLRYFDFIFRPFREINAKILGVKSIKGNIQMDINRAKSMGSRSEDAMKRAQGYGQQFNQMGQQQGGQMPQQGQPPGMPGMPQMKGLPGMGPPPGPNPNPPIITKGFW